MSGEHLGWIIKPYQTAPTTECKFIFGFYVIILRIAIYHKKR